MRTLFALLVSLSLLGCYTVLVPEEPGWEEWPRRGSVPIVTADCMTDACLEYREAVLVDNLGPNEERE